MENLMINSILKENLKNNRYTFFQLVLIIDVLLLLILYNQKLNTYDKYNIISILISHVIFIFALIQENIFVLDILHLFMTFCVLVLSLFVKNKFLLIVYILFWSCLFILWGLNGRCILGKYDTIIHESIHEYIFKSIIFNFHIFDILSIIIFVYLIYKFLR
tara:strand:+ start:7679 stop:8161 length:483 start_codon:yes stop_codon:yes gene_type:complete